MNRRPFISDGTHYTKNLRDGRSTKARPAILQSPGGGEERGLAFLLGGMPCFIIPAADALRLAHEIADNLDYLNGSDA